MAMVATVIAVPSPITNVAAMPAQNSPCASANTRTRMAPEHGRMPTVRTALKPRRHPPGPVDYSRLLVAELVDGAFSDVSGAIRPDWSMVRSGA